MKKFNTNYVVYIVLALGIFLLSWGWTNAEQRILELEDYAIELQAQKEYLIETNNALEATNGKLVDQKDNALAELHKTKGANDKKLEQQFYRGVYAGGLVLFGSKGMPIDQAVKMATEFVKGAVQNDAFKMKFPGVDKEAAPTEPGSGTAPNLQPRGNNA